MSRHLILRAVWYRRHQSPVLQMKKQSTRERLCKLPRIFNGEWGQDLNHICPSQIHCFQHHITLKTKLRRAILRCLSHKHKRNHHHCHNPCHHYPTANCQLPRSVWQASKAQELSFQIPYSPRGARLRGPDIITILSSSYRKVFMGSLSFQCVQEEEGHTWVVCHFQGKGSLDICWGV